MSRSNSIRVLTASLLGMALCVTTVESPAAARVKAVRGHILSELLTGPDCKSPVGLCTAGQFTGDIRGKFVFTAVTLTPSGDTATTGVMHYTGDIVIVSASLPPGVARGLENGRGDIFIKDSGAFNALPEGTGDVAAVSTIIGGTKGNIGLSGRIRIAGTFTPQDGGDSEYSGFIDLP
jgi:hypothetical protein